MFESTTSRDRQDRQIEINKMNALMLGKETSDERF